MFVSYLVLIIGLIPLVLSISLYRLYNGSKLTILISIYMIMISSWQLDIAVLYMVNVLPKDIILLLFRVFRAGPTFSIFIILIMVKYSYSKDVYIINDNKLKYFIYKFIYNDKLLVISFFVSLIIFIMNFTFLGIEDLTLYKKDNISYYFPEYGPLNFLYVSYMTLFLISLIILFFSTSNISSTLIKKFMRTFSVCSFFLFIGGFLNFIPATGALISSAGIVFFSILIIFSFIHFHNEMMISYNIAIERQKKLDYSGNLTASLIHEVKNSITVISGYSSLLTKKELINEKGAKILDEVKMSSNHLGKIVDNFYKYMKHNTLEFKTQDMKKVITKSIKLSNEVITSNNLNIQVNAPYKFIPTYMNETYICQVFINLIKNTSEAYEENQLNKHIDINVSIEKDNVIILYKDNAKGIPENLWKNIFNPFHSNKKDGLGMGLPFCKKILFEHRGDIIIIESKENEGTTFKITIPQFEFSNI